MSLLLAAAAEPAALDVLQKVDAFYTTSWQHLIGLGAVIGVVVPLLAQLYQRRAARLDDERLKGELAKRFDELAASLKGEFASEAAKLRQESCDAVRAADDRAKAMLEGLRADQLKSLEAAREELKKKVSGAEGLIYHLQGNMLAQRGLHAEAMASYLEAVVRIAPVSDEANLVRILTMIRDVCLKKVDSKNITDGHRKAWWKAKAALKELNKNGGYIDHVDALDARFKRPRTERGLQAPAES